MKDDVFKRKNYPKKWNLRGDLRGAIINWDRGSVKLSLTEGLLPHRNDIGNSEIQYRRVDYTILEELGL